MAIEFDCDNPACGKRLRMRDEAAGKKARCPACGQIKSVPALRAVEGTVELAVRFAGSEVTAARRHEQPVVNTALENPICLQVLFDDPPQWDTADLTRRVRRYHHSMTKGSFEVERAGEEGQSAFGLAGWGDHVVRFVAFDAPIPESVIRCCIEPAHYKPAMKRRAQNNRAHALLYYAGWEEDTLEQYVALAAVAGSLAGLEASVVTNESAHASLPAMVFDPAQSQSDQMDLLRNLPLLHLYCGFVKYEVEGVRGVWMRTYGAHEFGLPDFAYRARDHNWGERIFEIFGNTLNYLRESRAEIGPGHTMQVSDDMFVRLRETQDDEPFLDSGGEMLVMERIDEDEIGRGRPRRPRD
jgi:hypothetical protein